MSKPQIAAFQDHLGDFTASPRLLVLAAMAAVAGLGGTVAAFVLLKLIALCTNLAYYQTLSTVMRDFPAHLPLWTIFVPVAGGLIIGLMARYGTEKIRGHGIPEAIEAILIGQSKVAPKVAILKPLSSAISIGTGGPFGAEGPIIMTGGALGSLFTQLFHLSSAEHKTLLVAGAAAGMTAIFNTPIAAVLLAVELRSGAVRFAVDFVRCVLDALRHKARKALGNGPLCNLGVTKRPTPALSSHEH